MDDTLRGSPVSAVTEVDRESGDGDVWVAGVDGCRGGWLVVLRRLGPGGGRRHRTVMCASFAEVLALTPEPASVAVDMPIGLLDLPVAGGRECDGAARRLLGPRAASVFSAPVRAHLPLATFDEVRRIGGLSLQGFNLLPKVRELDDFLTPDLQRRVFEAHPELAFTKLAGSPMSAPKRSHAGSDERFRALTRAPDSFFRGVRGRVRVALGRWPRAVVAADDVLDATALTWTAARHCAGTTTRIPRLAPVDSRGLEMSIRY